MLFGLVQEAKEVTPELLRVEAHSKVLYAQITVRVDKRSKEHVSTSPPATFDTKIPYRRVTPPIPIGVLVRKAQPAELAPKFRAYCLARRTCRAQGRR
jgi:hypothetical protein